MSINVNPPTKPETAQLTRRPSPSGSAGEVPPPTMQLEPVAKLIDVSKCIGCKACQAACIEWNDTHPADRRVHRRPTRTRTI